MYVLHRPVYLTRDPASCVSDPTLELCSYSGMVGDGCANAMQQQAEFIRVVSVDAQHGSQAT
jgi:hypothetical protein